MLTHTNYDIDVPIQKQFYVKIISLLDGVRG